MPTFYAHYRFGQQVLAALPDTIRPLCEEKRALFDIGLHGPDIFFYYRPLLPNTVTKFGRQCHTQIGTHFLPQAARAIQQFGAPARAYFYGFLCHLALDSLCHPGVYEAQHDTGQSHADIETSLDRSLLVLDGMDPLSHDPCGHIAVSPDAAEIIAAFFPPIRAKSVERSLRSMQYYGRLFYTNNVPLRRTIHFLLRLFGLSGMMMTEAPNMCCAESDRRLMARSDEAVEIALQLIEETATYIESGKAVGDVFNRTFKGPA